MARDAIAALLEVPPNSFDVALEAVLDPEIHDIVREAQQRRADAERAQREAAATMTDAAAKLVKNGVTVRDAGALLGVSHQRIAQLVAERDA